jgi:hypothetical protein
MKTICIDWGNGDIEEIEAESIKAAKKFCKDNYTATPVRIYEQK